MFDNCSLLAILDDKRKNMVVKRVVQDSSTQEQISFSFSRAVGSLLDNRSPVDFDGKYNPQDDSQEYLRIHNYNLEQEIKNALINPLGLESYQPENGVLPKIRALFVGECTNKNGKDHFTVAFQRFKKDQYITQTKFHLLFSNDTFRKVDEIGISISPYVDCVFQDGELFFISYHFAKQILDLSSYYREATNDEISNFISSNSITMENGDKFVEQSNSWERKKIASINDSGVLRRFTAMQIMDAAKSEGVEITVRDKHIVLPEDRNIRRIVLGFLDEEVYSGAFSKILFQTNSKRKAK